ncbi:unnamed protein product [Ectocarpus sp. 6 AP-2014]
MNKAGGSTVKYMLAPWTKAQNVTVGLYDSPQWLEGKDFAQDFLGDENSLMWGAYTEGLRPFGGLGLRECKWFTIFRHPIPRLVSAYFYCKKKPQDGLCATVALDANADDTNLYAFAEHWGDFGLRQFALAFVLPEELLANKVKYDATGICTPYHGKRSCPGWYELKLYLQQQLDEQEQGAESRGWDGSGAAASGAATISHLLQPVQELLTNEYAAVGVLEQWETSLLLFNEALGMPGFDWPEAFGSIGKKNSDGTFHNEEAEMLLRSWTDPRLRRYLSLDLLLYDYAVSVHNQQVDKYGLGEGS